MSNKEIVVNYEVDGQDIKLTQNIVKQFLTGGADVTLPEFKMFSELCKIRGLNPFLKEAYIIKYGSSPAQIVVSKEAILKRAILDPDFNGRKQGVIVIDNKGNVSEKNGTMVLADETLVGGWAKVYRKNWDYPVYVTVSFSEVAQRKRDGQLNGQWSKNPAMMTEKVALVRALREAFVDNVGGMYDSDEIDTTHQERVINEPEQENITQEEPVFEVETDNDDDKKGVIDINDL